METCVYSSWEDLTRRIILSRLRYLLNLLDLYTNRTDAGRWESPDSVLHVRHSKYNKIILMFVIASYYVKMNTIKISTGEDRLLTHFKYSFAYRRLGNHL